MVQTSQLVIGVLMGGRSIECEVSFNSGRTICDHLDTNLFTVIPLFQTTDGTLYQLPWHFLHRGKTTDFIHRLADEAEKIIWDDLPSRIDFMYISLHGRYGEDGCIQGLMEVLAIPYIGSKVLASAFSMDKALQQNFFKRHKIPAPRSVIIKSHDSKTIDLKNIQMQLDEQNIAFPLIVKPSCEGSSLGINVAYSPKELKKSIDNARTIDHRHEQDVLLQEKITGMEFVCILIQNAKQDWSAFPITEVVPENGCEIYDYEQKYMPGRAHKITPARCTQEDTQRIQALCARVAKLCNFSTIVRIDGFLQEDGNIIILDLNTLPGTAPATFLFHQAAEVGLNHTQLINKLIIQEFSNYKGSLMQEAILNANNQKNDKKRIGVLLGGNTNEREISLESGRNVCYKLSPHKYEVTPLFVDDQMKLHALSTRQLLQNSTREIQQSLDGNEAITWNSLAKDFDFIFIGLHGGIGENGSVQGTLEMLNIPYNGSGVLTSSLTIDKYRTNTFLQENGFSVPQSYFLTKANWTTLTEEEQSTLCQTITKKLHTPLIVKPHDDGCSVMVNMVKSIDDMIKAIHQLFNEGQSEALIEEYIIGTELTCGVLGNNETTVLPPSQVITQNNILSIEEKFLPGQGENQTPALIPADAQKLVQETIGNAYQALGCKGYARIDCFYQNAEQSPTNKPRVVILECNSLPGLTPATCIFHQAAEIGLRPMEFIDQIIELGFEEHSVVSDKGQEVANALI